ncbi:hypothetical protein V8B55DRAFT_1077439 [Mucor lusitanicus]
MNTCLAASLTNLCSFFQASQESIFPCYFWHCLLFFISGTPGVDISFITSCTVFFSLSQARQELIFPLSFLALSLKHLFSSIAKKLVFIFFFGFPCQWPVRGESYYLFCDTAL